MMDRKELVKIGKEYLAAKQAIYNAYANYDLGYCWEYCTSWIWENYKEHYDYLKGFVEAIRRVKTKQRDAAAVAIEYGIYKKDVLELANMDVYD